MKNGFTMRQTLRGIQLFVATYEELSFTLAASRENTTQSDLNTFNLVSLNKTLMLNGSIGQYGTNGCHSTIGLT